MYGGACLVDPTWRFVRGVHDAFDCFHLHILKP